MIPGRRLHWLKRNVECQLEEDTLRKALLLVIIGMSLLALNSCASRTAQMVEFDAYYEETNSYFELDITDTTAIAVADAVFLQRYGIEYMEKTKSKIVDYPLAEKEYNSSEYIKVIRSAKDPTDDVDEILMVIRRSDGKIMRIYTEL